jgi:hypothetical protein
MADYCSTLDLQKIFPSIQGPIRRLINGVFRVAMRIPRMSRLSDIASYALATAFFILIAFPPSLAADPGREPSNLTETLAARGKNLSAFKAVMAVATAYDRGKSHQEMKGFLLYRRPNDFRFQGVGAGGASLFEMIVKADKFELYVPSDAKILKGGRNCLMTRFPELGELDSLIPLALLQWKTAQALKVVPSGPDASVVTMNFNGRDWRATLEKGKLHLLRLEKLRSGEVELTAEFGDFKEGEYGWLPRRFDIQAPAAGWRTVVSISKMEINPFLVEKNFQLETTFSTNVEECK